MPPDPLVLQQAHRHFAAAAFNACWELLDLPECTPEQDREMIRRAEVSFWHWQHASERTAENDAIGYWQLARAYCLAGELVTAEAYAQAGLEIVRAHNLGPLLEGYAWESLARCHAKARRHEKCRTALAMAWEVAGKIEELDERAALEADLRTVVAEL